MQRLSIFSIFPQEIVTNEIFSHLSLSDLMLTDFISKEFLAYGRADDVWRSLFKKYFCVDLKGSNCRESFMLHYQCEMALAKNEPDYAFPDDEAKNLIIQTHAALKEFMMRDNKKLHICWTNYLAGMLNVAHIDLDLGKKLLLTAAKQGNPKAMLFVADECLFYSLVEEGLAWLLKSHEKGFPEATYRLAEYYMGRIVDVDGGYVNPAPNKAKYLEMLNQAAQVGHPEALIKLSEIQEEEDRENFYITSLFK